MSASVRMELTADVIGSSPFSGILKRAHALGVSEFSASQVQMANGQSDVSALVTGIATITALIIYSDQTISFKLNGGSAVTLNAKGFLALIDTSITALTISNASGNTANIYVFLAGS